MDALKQVVAETFHIAAESVPDDASNQSLPQWDSLGHMNLIMAIEKRFGVQFTLEEIIELRDLPAIRQTLAKKKAG